MDDVAGGAGEKLHVGVDQAGVIVAQALAEATVDDATTAITLIGTVYGAVARITADTADDTIAFYNTATAAGATVVVPPAKTATVSGRGPRSSA
jgi:hypothetical protein